MSFAPKPGLEPGRGDSNINDKPSNLYTGAFGSKPSVASDATFVPVNNVDNLATTIQELCSAKDFSFEVTVGYIAQSLLKLFSGSGVAIAVEQAGGSVVCCASAEG